MKGLTKRERQVTDKAQILHILDTAKVLNLGLSVNDEPYVVPMNYGYIMEDGKLTLYLHSAVKGKKLDMIQANPRVFFSMDCDRMPFEGRVACQYGLVYSSIMGSGTATLVDDVEEKKRAMSILMKTQTGGDFTFEDRLVTIVTVIRIDVAEYTAKHRPLPEGYEVIYGRK
ncbi:MAG: pyridoxamine 5'-phosphate oxidase family protein [Oscillospiraceae bacterium]|jgi:nitroimidazol reductase NimA-like FMN-containing flavoprotein (pyridoxamine 5'-phosphate oxidase superfamily)